MGLVDEIQCGITKQMEETGGRAIHFGHIDLAVCGIGRQVCPERAVVRAGGGFGDRGHSGGNLNCGSGKDGLGC